MSLLALGLGSFLLNARSMIAVAVTAAVTESPAAMTGSTGRGGMVFWLIRWIEGEMQGR